MADDLEFPALMTVAEAGKVLRKSPGVMRYMLRRGDIQGVHIGQRWMITADEVRRVIREGTRRAEQRKQDRETPVELAGGRQAPRRVEYQDQEDEDDRPAVDPDQLALDLARRGGSGDRARRDPKMRVIGERGWQ